MISLMTSPPLTYDLPPPVYLSGTAATGATASPRRARAASPSSRRRARPSDLRLGACRFRETAMPGPRKTACSLRVLSGKASQPGWKCSTDRPRPTGPGTGACPPGRPSGPGPRPRRAPQYPLSTLWATCPDVPPGYTRPAVGLPYHGVCRWVRQPAEWTRRSVRWATDSALAHHTPSVSSLS